MGSLSELWTQALEIEKRGEGVEGYILSFW
jgi:hypothetical protein